MLASLRAWCAAARRLQVDTTPPTSPQTRWIGAFPGFGASCGCALECSTRLCTRDTLRLAVRAVCPPVTRTCRERARNLARHTRRPPRLSARPQQRTERVVPPILESVRLVFAGRRRAHASTRGAGRGVAKKAAALFSAERGRPGGALAARLAPHARLREEGSLGRL